MKIKGTFDEYKKKRAELEKARRLRQKESMKKLSDAKRKQFIEEKRVENRKRVQKYRNKQEGSSTENGTENSRKENDNRESVNQPGSYNFVHSYKTNSAISKAYSKTNKTLPSSPTKRKVIASKLFRSFNHKDRQDLFGCGPRIMNKRETGLSATLVSAIQVFYERDDVSRISPNVKDAKYFRNPATKEKELRQIRHLMFNLSDVYVKFAQEYRRELFFIISKVKQIRRT